jgi:adenylate cyclase
MRMRLSLRQKLLLFAVAIAILPLIVAGRTMIRIAQDELKSSANEQLVVTAQQLVGEINDLYERTWLAPLVLIRNALDDPQLGVEEKISLLTLGIADIPDIVALQVTVEGASLPLVVVKDDFAARLKGAGLDSLDVLRVPAGLVTTFRDSGGAEVSEVRYVPQTDDWLATVVLPMRSLLGEGQSTFSARIDLDSLRQMIQTHPFTRTGLITIVDASGHKVFDPAQADITDHEIVAEAIGLLSSRTQLISVEPYARPDGEVMLGAFAFPRPFDWALLVEKSQRDAYLAIEKMLHSLGLWVVLGLAVAIAGAIALALRISRPILKIDRVANQVAHGNFQARVEGVRTRDEIGDLARRMNDMVVGLNERFQLAKFVSSGTLLAIKSADREGVRLGGKRRLVTMVFCDIRGYTAFAERHDPEVVVEVLNLYFQNLSELVVGHGGDIDKYVGDQIVAVFQGEQMVANAVRCALAMQGKVATLAAEHPDWHLTVGIGINTGEVIMGAMGSRERMDYTVLGDHVNLAARLCGEAGPGQTLISASSQRAIAGSPEFAITALAPLVVKGKREAVTVYQASAPVGHPASAAHPVPTSV